MKKYNHCESDSSTNIVSSEINKYHPTKNSSIPASDLIKVINENLDNGIEYFEDLYEKLRQSFQIKNFNRNKLKRFLMNFFEFDKKNKVVARKLLPPHLDNIFLRDEKYQTYFNICKDYIYQNDIREIKFLAEPDILRLKKKLIERATSRNHSVNSLNAEIDTIDKSMKVIRLLDWGKSSEDIHNDYCKKISCLERATSNISKLEHQLLDVSTFYTEEKIVKLAKLMKVPNFNSIHQLKDRQFLEENCEVFDEILYLIDLMQLPPQGIIKRELEQILYPKNHVLKYLIERRASGESLEKIGFSMGITRERVRQLEQAALKKWKTQTSRSLKNFALSFNLISNHNDILTITDLQKEIGHDAPVLRYLLSKSEIWENAFSTVYECFILDSRISIRRLQSEIEELPTVLNEENLKDFFENYNTQYPSRMTFESLKYFLSYHYDLKGITLIKKNTKNNEKLEMIKTVCKQHFSHGIHIFSEKDIDRLKQEIEKQFGNQDWLDQSTRSIGNYISRHFKLIDKGKYINEDDYPTIPSEILNDVHEYIINNDKMHYFEDLFNLFEGRLYQEGIRNYHHFAAALKDQSKESFTYVRQYITYQSSMKNYRDSILDLVNTFPSYFSVVDIKMQLNDVSEKTISNILSELDYLVQFDEEYIHEKKYVLPENLEQKMIGLIDKILSEQPMFHLDKVFTYLMSSSSKLLNENKIHSPSILGNIIRVKYSQKYDVKKPFVVKSQAPFFTSDEYVRNRLKDKPLISVSDIKQAFNEISTSKNNLRDFILTFIPDYYWVSQETLHKKELTGVDDYVIEELFTLLKRVLSKESFKKLNVGKLRNYLPEINVEWSNEIILSIISEYNPTIKIEYIVPQYQNLQYRLKLGE